MIIRRKIGLLAGLAIIFTLTALVRVVGDIGPIIAFARASVVSVTDSCVQDAAITELMTTLKTRETALSQHEDDLADRSRALEIADKRIQERLAALTEAEQSLAATVTIADRAADDDVARLVTVYQTMKPKDAAPLFAAMTPEFAAGFLGRMDPTSAAPIFALLSPETAYAISVIVAGRNAGAPTH